MLPNTLKIEFFVFLIVSIQGSFLRFDRKFSYAGIREGNADGVDVESYVYDRANTTTLKLVQVLFRHGARRPLNAYPKDPYANYDWGVKGHGQLTPSGKRQGYDLGKYLRSRYEGFLSSDYSYDEIYVESSSTDRTIMTAEMCVAGMYPVLPDHEFSERDILQDLNWQPIPVHPIPLKMDNKIWTGDLYCPRQIELFKEELVSPDFQNFSKESNEWLYSYLSQHTGWNMNFDKTLSLTDLLMVEEKEGLKLPDWTKQVYPETLVPIMEAWLLVNTSTPELTRFRMGPFMAEFVQNIEMAIEGRPSASWTEYDLRFYHFRPVKAYLFSGHDATISAVLDSFGLYDRKKPAYASALILELHSASDSKNEDDFTVKLFYKKKTYQPIKELEFPECPNPCTISSFKQKYKHLILGEEEWRDECKLKF